MTMQEKKHKPFKLIHLLLIILVSLLIVAFFITPCCPTKKQVIERVCRANLCQISLLLRQSKPFPALNNWCDITKQLANELDSENGNHFFMCFNDKFGPCSYAMNENIPADANELPGDLILLFESAPGWNKIGGADDVVTDRHDKPGANITFADGRVEFVTPERIAKLRWKIEK